MQAEAQKYLLNSLAVEWERIELLAHLVTKSRQGRPPSQALLTSLQQLQGEVEENRRQGRGLVELALCHLNSTELDVLACVLAPEAEPRLGWIFQNLQIGLPQPYPTIALLQELLSINSEESSQFYEVFGESAPLRRLGLIKVEEGDPFRPVRPAPGVTARFLRRPPVTPDLPGAILVKIRAGWDELILPPDRLTMLGEFILWIIHKTKVVKEWGGQDCGGPVALFSGPSGTGKTFAAAVLATELGWPLYRVDLGRLVSKYIGETEKNLNHLFDTAHGQPMILQFDEADSLFSKRGEVKEARDRYANMEVSHLLARIESHHGPVILTTNLHKHLDPAFARRFQLVVDFPRPDAKARTFLWQRLLPPKAPGSAEMDFPFLGQSVNLTGGQIRNASLHAAYLAVGDGQRITIRHIALAVWRELGKDGRELSKTDLGALARFLPEDGLC